MTLLLAHGVDGGVGVFRSTGDGGLEATMAEPQPIAGFGGDAVLVPGAEEHYYYALGSETQINGFALEADGSLRPLADSPYPFPAVHVAAGPRGRFLFASDPTHGNRIHVLEIGAGTGVLSAAGGSPFPHDSADDVGALATLDGFLFAAGGPFDPFSTTVSVYSVDPATGRLGSVQGSPFQTGSSTFTGAGAAAAAVCPVQLAPTPSPTTPKEPPTPTPTAPASQCAGDCNHEGSVTVDELVRGVSFALSGGLPLQCAAMDGNADGRVSVDELVTAVRHALQGCP